MDENGKFRGITEEEYGRIVEYPVPITLLSIELDREAPRISCGVRRALLSTNGGKTSDAFSLLSNVIEHVQRSLVDVSDESADVSHKLTRSLISCVTSNSP